MGMDGQRHAPAALPPENPGTHCIGGWVGPRAGLKSCGKSGPHRDSIAGPSNPWRDAIPTTISRPTYTTALKCVCFVYVLCLQNNPVYVLPWLEFVFLCWKVSLVVDIAYCILILCFRAS